MPSFLDKTFQKVLKHVGHDGQEQQQQPEYNQGYAPPAAAMQGGGPGGPKVTVGYYPNWAIYGREYKPQQVSR